MAAFTVLVREGKAAACFGLLSGNRDCAGVHMGLRHTLADGATVAAC